MSEMQQGYILSWLLGIMEIQKNATSFKILVKIEVGITLTLMKQNQLWANLQLPYPLIEISRNLANNKKQLSPLQLRLEFNLTSVFLKYLRKSLKILVITGTNS